MIRPSIALASLAVLGLAAGVYARSHRAEDLVDRVQGVRIASRLPCDGSTNPQEELNLETTFSPGGWQRSFHEEDCRKTKSAVRAGASDSGRPGLVDAGVSKMAAADELA